MAKGRGSAIVALVLVGAITLLHFEMAQAATYTVGGPRGWTFNVTGWPQGKRFRAGDILVFNYSPSYHNLVRVNQAGYNSCKAPAGSKVFTSGKDRIKLGKGQSFFICSFPGHCQGAMKIAVNAN